MLRGLTTRNYPLVTRSFAQASPEAGGTGRARDPEQ
jgi:hypothetical protein